MDESEIKMIVIDKVLQRVFKERSLSPTSVATRTGLTQPTVSNWYNGSHKPSDFVKVKILADYLNLTLDELIFDEPRREKIVETKSISTDDLISAHLGNTKFEVIVRKISEDA